ncbi:unnamed protein product [Cyprideis torosa]|uniref:Uncharacterized protein n=1 Tax=Cyprideis torosa TaxID=163714 RepID=A0A7R8W4Q3_9CRUS|nr:unnamed protein product [Cyprideis torosa]CAG0884479.1 unnamed protein product [Cyprideis torosa]
MLYDARPKTSVNAKSNNGADEKHFVELVAETSPIPGIHEEYDYQPLDTARAEVFGLGGQSFKNVIARKYKGPSRVMLYDASPKTSVNAKSSNGADDKHFVQLVAETSPIPGIHEKYDSQPLDTARAASAASSDNLVPDTCSQALSVSMTSDTDNSVILNSQETSLELMSISTSMSMSISMSIDGEDQEPQPIPSENRITIPPRTLVEREWFQQLFTENGWHRYEAGGGGDCQFLAIAASARAAGLRHVPSDPTQLRRLVFNELRHHRVPGTRYTFLEPTAQEKLRARENGQTLATSMKQFRQRIKIPGRLNGEWGTELSAEALANRLDIRLEIYSTVNHDRSIYGSGDRIVRIGHSPLTQHYFAIIPQQPVAIETRAHTDDFITDMEGSDNEAPTPTFSPDAPSESSNPTPQPADTIPAPPAETPPTWSTTTTCDCCLRHSTARINIKVTRQERQFKAWSAILYSMMTSSTNEYETVRHKIWNLLSSELQDMWSAIEGQVPHESNCPVFADATYDLQDFNANILRSPGGFTNSLDTHCFPTVKCALGCWIFPDYCQNIQFHHFLAYRTGFNFPGSKPELFNSARPDWPNPPRRYFEWTVSPTLVMDELNGLSVLVCKDHTTNDLKSRFFHIPINPFYEDDMKQAPQFLAPAAITPTIARGGRIGQYTSSTPVVKSIGGYFGLSTFHIGENQDMYEYDEKHMMMECLAAENREEIRNTFLNNLGIEVYKNHMRQYNRKCEKLPPLSDTVAKSCVRDHGAFRSSQHSIEIQNTLLCFSDAIGAEMDCDCVLWKKLLYSVADIYNSDPQSVSVSDVDSKEKKFKYEFYGAFHYMQRCTLV